MLVFITAGLKTVARMGLGVDTHHDSIEAALGPRKTLQPEKLPENLFDQSPHHCETVGQSLEPA